MNQGTDPLPSWWLYRGGGRPMDVAERDQRWPAPPPWRAFHGAPDAGEAPSDDGESARRLGHPHAGLAVDHAEVSIVNTAIYLRRPLLITGNPGSGKSSLAYRIGSELGLGRVLRWPITSRVTLGSGLYAYDAIGRARAARPDTQRPDTQRIDTQRVGPERAGPQDGTGDGQGDDLIGDFITLGPLGTALLPHRRPRVLLIDEIDKSDIDLPNDLLNIFEDGEFILPELVRLRARAPEVTVHTADPGRTATIHNGVIRCREFPVVVITSNGERDFPPAFLRRCVRMRMEDPTAAKLAAMVAAHFPADGGERSRELLTRFLEQRSRVGSLAADQLLNAVYLATTGALAPGPTGWDPILNAVWERLSPAEA